MPKISVQRVAMYDKIKQGQALLYNKKERLNRPFYQSNVDDSLSL